MAGSGCLWGVACGGVTLPEDPSEAGTAGATSAHDVPDASPSNSGDGEPSSVTMLDGSSSDAGVAVPLDSGMGDAGSAVSTSGVDPALLMPELSPAELRRFCEWSVLTIMTGGPACVALAVEGEFLEGCLSGAPLLCDTVAALEQCMRDMATNDCMPEALSSCQELSECESAGTPTEPVPSVCTPGAARSCLCADGTVGSQVCLNDGSGFTACACGGPPPE